MKTFTSVLSLAAALAATVTAVPVSEPSTFQIYKAKVANKFVRRQYTSDTENQLNDGTACRAVTIIYARGTSETGNVGELVGPPFFDAVAADIGTDNLAVQGVDYSASIAGFLEGGDPTGSTLMASLVEQALTQCPDTKVVMSGYSQGGQLVHNAAAMLSATVSAEVSAVVIFGDPDNGEAVGSIASSKVLIICHALDDICLHGDIIDTEHLDYAENVDQAATFVQTETGV